MRSVTLDGVTVMQFDRVPAVSFSSATEPVEVLKVDRLPIAAWQVLGPAVPAQAPAPHLASSPAPAASAAATSDLDQPDAPTGAGEAWE